MGGAGGPGEPAGDLARFGTALGRLARWWLWWIFVGQFGITVEVADLPIGIYPFAWILAPLILLALLDLRAAAHAPAVRAFTVVLAVGTVTAALALTGTLVQGNDRTSALGSLALLLVMLDLGLFSLAMVGWAEATPAAVLGPEGARLADAWRRSARWAWVGLATVLAATLAAGIYLAATGQSWDADRKIEVEGAWSTLVFVIAIVLALRPLFSVAGSTTRTRRALEPPVVVRPRRRPLAQG